MYVASQRSNRVTEWYFALDFNGTRDSRKIRSVCDVTRIGFHVKAHSIHTEKQREVAYRQTLS